MLWPTPYQGDMLSFRSLKSFHQGCIPWGWRLQGSGGESF